MLAARPSHQKVPQPSYRRTLVEHYLAQHLGLDNWSGDPLQFLRLGFLEHVRARRGRRPRLRADVRERGREAHGGDVLLETSRRDKILYVISGFG